MDAKNLYWTVAFAYMALMVAIAGLAWWRARRGDIANHRRLMNAASMMVLLFVVSYAVKVALVGKETLSTWDPRRVLILRVHETFVAAMLVAGGMARFLARRLGSAEPSHPTGIRRHRISGRIAVISGALALATAWMVLFGMYTAAKQI